MGGNSFKSSNALDDIKQKLPSDIVFAGLGNFGNTCYLNSIVQSLYSCSSFRENIFAYHERKLLEKRRGGPPYEPTLLNCLADLCSKMNSSKKRYHVAHPETFYRQLQQKNEFFRGPQQQDAHEFMNYLLNEVIDDLRKDMKESMTEEELESFKDENNQVRTWIQEIFEGKLTSETQCLRCLNVTTRDEVFLDLSVDVGKNCSIYHCLKQFSGKSMLSGKNKYYCENCKGRQEAFKRMRIRQLPEVLVLHLKRFEYVEEKQSYMKSRDSVPFPMHLKIPNTTEGTKDALRDYELFAIVVHIGASPRFGHYVACVCYHGFWFLFDDDRLQQVPTTFIETLFGSDGRNHVRDSYILFYQSTTSEHTIVTEHIEETEI